MKTYKITLFGVKETTKIIAEYLNQNGIKVDLIVSIDATVAKKFEIANYFDLKNTAHLIGADYYSVKKYSLQHLEDNFFEDNVVKIVELLAILRVTPKIVLLNIYRSL